MKGFLIGLLTFVGVGVLIMLGYYLGMVDMVPQLSEFLKSIIA